MKIITSLFENKKAILEACLTMLVSTILVGIWNDIYVHFYADAAPGIWELIGTVTCLACVWLTVRQNMWCWPIGIVSSAFLAYAFFTYNLLSSAVLNGAYFFPIQFWGWWNWKYGGNGKTELNVVVLNIKECLLIASLIGIAVYLWGTFMNISFSPASPYWDAFILFASVVAQWMMSKKHIQSWFIWFLVDFVSIFVYWNAKMPMVAILSVVFLGTAVRGFTDWSKTLLEPRKVENV